MMYKKFRNLRAALSVGMAANVAILACLAAVPQAAPAADKQPVPLKAQQGTLEGASAKDQMLVVPSGNAASAAAAPATSAQAADAATSAAGQPIGNRTATADGAVAGATDNASADGSAPGKVLVKPGMPISVGMTTEDINPTDNVELARQQAIAYPNSPEACFILAVALTRTSQVEEALKEVRHAKNLAAAQGGAKYFDHMIDTYEHMLEYCPDENRVRYALAWAYYMKAYLLTKETQAADPGAVAGRSAATPAAAGEQNKHKAKGATVKADVASQVLSMISPQLGQNLPEKGKISTQELPHIPSALESAPPSVVPQVKKYYEAALKNLDDLLARKPDDIWARVYRGHLYAEYTGDLGSAMSTWRDCQSKCPQNPASYFFLGEGYLRQGNLKECLSNISRAIALRALGN